MATLATMLALAAASAGAGVCAGATGFGRAILIHVFVITIAAISNGDVGGDACALTRIVAIIAVTGSLSLGPLAVASFSDLNPALAMLMAIPSLLFTVVFTGVMLAVPEAPVTLALGVGLCAFALWKWSWTLAHPDEDGEGTQLDSRTTRQPRQVQVRVRVGPNPKRCWSDPEAGKHRASAPYWSASTCSLVSVTTETGGPQGFLPAAAKARVAPSSSVECSPTAAARKRPDTPAPAAIDNRGVLQRLTGWVTAAWPSQRVAWAAVAAGAASGVTQGLAGIASPPIMAFVALAGLHKSEVRATFLMVSFLSNATQMIHLAAVGVVAVDDWLLYLVAVVGCWIGMAVGYKLHDQLSHRRTRYIVTTLLSVSAVVMLVRGQPPVVAALVAVGFSLAVCVVWAAVVCRRRSSQTGSASGRRLQQLRQRFAACRAGVKRACTCPTMSFDCASALV